MVLGIPWPSLHTICNNMLYTCSINSRATENIVMLPLHLYLISAQRTSDTTGSASGNLAGLGTGGAVTSDSSGLTHVLLVTSSVRVIHRVHGHTSNLGPLVSLHSVLVESATSLQDGLVGSTATGNQTNHGSARVRDGLLGSRRKSDSGDTLLGILRDNDGIITRSSGKLATVTDFGLNVADDSSLRDLSDRKNVSNSKTGCKLKRRL